jgi:hypothetical protein
VFLSYAEESLTTVSGSSGRRGEPDPGIQPEQTGDCTCTVFTRKPGEGPDQDRTGLGSELYGFCTWTAGLLQSGLSCSSVVVVMIILKFHEIPQS